MHIKPLFKLTINNKQMYSPSLYKYQDSYVLYKPAVHTFGSVFFTHTLLVQTHTHDISASWVASVIPGILVS